MQYRSANLDTDAADVKRYGVTEANTLVLDYNGKTQLLLPRLADGAGLHVGAAQARVGPRADGVLGGGGRRARA